MNNMVTKIKLIAVVALIYATTVFSTCNKTILGCSEESHSFQINAIAYPDKDSIHIGDTLWLEVNAPTTLKDVFSGKMMDYSGAANLGTVVTLLQFFPDKNTSGAINNFYFFIQQGSKSSNTVDPLSNQVLLVSEVNGSYKLKLGLIPSKIGNYVLTISNATNVYRKNDKCAKASFTIDFSETNQHFYLLKLWRPDLVLDDLGKSKVYYFKVY